MTINYAELAKQAAQGEDQANMKSGGGSFEREVPAEGLKEKDGSLQLKYGYVLSYILSRTLLLTKMLTVRTLLYLILLTFIYLKVAQAPCTVNCLALLTTQASTTTLLRW